MEYDLFIKPSEERLLTLDELADINRQFMDRDAGKTVNDAFYFLAQAFSRLGQASLPSKMASWVSENFEYLKTLCEGNIDEAYETRLDEDSGLTEEYWKYENVTVNIWLAKGHHHLIQCNEMIDLEPNTCFDTDGFIKG